MKYENEIYYSDVDIIQEYNALNLQRYTKTNRTTRVEMQHMNKTYSEDEDVIK
jgi:hypothetical protein